MRSTLCALLFVALAQAACERRLTLEEIERTNRAAAAELKVATGREALVSLYQERSHLRITVRLRSASPAEAEQARSRVDDIVKRHWPAVDEIVVLAQPE